MRIASLIARYLLGFIFLVFGLNGFLHFIPSPPPSGPLGMLFGALSASPYLSVIFALQLIGGVLLLLGQYVPLALTILAPIIVNIVLIHLFMAPAGIPTAAVVVLLWLLVAYHHRASFAPLLSNRH